MDNTILKEMIDQDLQNGKKPFLVIGTAGDLSTGVVDDLAGMASICKTYDLWFHIDGAYGASAAVLPKLKHLFQGMEEADSIALDPHKCLASLPSTGKAKTLKISVSLLVTSTDFSSLENDPPKIFLFL